MTRRRGARDGEAGFSLIEAVVALAVAALAMAAVYQLISTGLSGAREAEARARAVLLAQSLLADLETGPLQAAERSGGETGLRWHTRVALYRTLPLPAEPAAPPDDDEEEDNGRRGPRGGEGLVPALHLLEVTVAWGEGEGRRFELRSLRLGAVP